MADHGRALGAARPVATGAIRAGRKSPAFRRRAGQDVMTVRCKAHARNDLAPLSQRRVHAKLVIVAVQIIDVLSDDFALEILPRAVANAVTRIDRRLAVGSLGAQIGVPGFSSRAVALAESRMGAVTWAMRQRSVSHPRSSNRTCRSPASGSPTGFIVRHTEKSCGRKRLLCSSFLSFALRYSFL